MSLRPPSGLRGIPSSVSDYIVEVYKAITDLEGSRSWVENTLRKLNLTSATPTPATASSFPNTPPSIQVALGLASGITIIQDTWAHITNYPAANYVPGTLYYVTDRTVYYQVNLVASVRTWQYAFGKMASTFGARPTGLGANDAGFLLQVTVYEHDVRWGGSAWFFQDGGGGYIVDSPVALGLGWQEMDGTATDYLVDGGADLSVTAYTTVDEKTANVGTYHKSGAYTGVVNAATAGAMSGVTALATTGITVTAHAVVDDLAAGAGNAVFATPADAAHTVNEGAGHQHLFGTIAVDATGQPKNMAVRRFFRR